MGLEDIARSLDQRFRVLTGGPRTSSRHRSLRAVLDWSYEQLDPIVQRVFERLATFAGRFDLDAAGDVAAGDGVDPDNVTPAVLRLVDCSLLTEHPGAGPNRYSLLETMRSYGLERLTTQGALARARHRHAHWALELAERAATELAGPREGEWAGAVREHLDELRAAHAWLVGSDSEASLRLAVALHPYALWRVQSEVLRWAEVAAGAAAGSGSPRLSAVLASAAAGAWQRGDLDAAGAAARAALEAARDLDRRGHRPALEALADVAILLGDLPEADTLFREAYELALSAGDLLQAVWDIGSASLARAWSGDAEAAGNLAAEAFATAERSGSPTARAFAHYVVGEISTPKDAAAEEHLGRALELAEAVNSTFVVGLARVALATLKARQDDAAGALRYYEAVIVEWQRAGAWTSQWVTLRTLVDLLVRVGAVRDAAILYGAVETARTGARPFGADEAMLREAATELRAQLGEDTFRRFADEGANLTEDEVVGVALDAVHRARR
jgi:tetratricopeptide (TPR) repeat protein